MFQTLMPSQKLWTQAKWNTTPL